MEIEAGGGLGGQDERGVREILRELKTELDVKVAFVCEPVPGHAELARVVACWIDDEFQTGHVYEVAGTPCGRVYEHGSTYHSHGVTAMYPDDKLLVAWGVEAYLGIAIHDADDRLSGHVGVMDEKALAHPARVETALRKVAHEISNLHQLTGH